MKCFAHFHSIEVIKFVFHCPKEIANIKILQTHSLTEKRHAEDLQSLTLEIEESFSTL